MKYNKLNRHLSNKVNPFLGETMNHVEKGEKTIMFSNKEPDLIIDSDGVVKGHSILVRKIKVDKAKFVKVFQTGLTNWFDLSKSAIRVFGYIAENIKPNRDFVIIDFDDLTDYTKYKSRSILMSSLSELVDNKFIARGQAFNLYFINPTIFFNGDRLTLISHYETVNENQSEYTNAFLSEINEKEIQSNSESR